MTFSIFSGWTKDTSAAEGTLSPSSSDRIRFVIVGCCEGIMTDAPTSFRFALQNHIVVKTFKNELLKNFPELMKVK